MPQTDPHPLITDPNRELCRIRTIVVTYVACGPEALAGFGIDGDQRLVAVVVNRGQVVEKSAGEARLGPQKAHVGRLRASALEAFL